VLDNEGEWEEVFREVASKHGIPPVPNGYGEAKWIHEPGIGITPNWRRYFPDDQDKVDKLSRETWNAYEPNFRVNEGIGELVVKIKEKGWQTALCTGSNWNVVESELEQLNLYLAFDVTTTGEEVALLKPDPEIYLLTAQKMGLEPEECVVIEDSVAGVRAGVEAGCKVIALESEYAPAKLLNAAGANVVVGSFGEIEKLMEEV
jgi:HAD superfamily hydrolase (TIGR01509 family)